MAKERETMISKTQGPKQQLNKKQGPEHTDPSLQQAAKRYIIVVDDDEEDRQLFVLALQQLKLNAKIDTFNNGVDLMAKLMEPMGERPDLIFLDLNMPLMNGEECLADIRHEIRLKEVPIVIYSGYYDRHKLKILKGKGADHFFKKPNTFSQLKSLIKESIATIENRKGLKDFFIR